MLFYILVTVIPALAFIYMVSYQKRGDVNEAIIVSFLAALVATLVVVLIVAPLATVFSDNWRVKDKGTINSEIISNNEYYSFTVNDVGYSVNEKSNSTSVYPTSQENPYYVRKCDDTPNAVLPFNMGGCVDEIYLPPDFELSVKD